MISSILRFLHFSVQLEYLLIVYNSQATSKQREWCGCGKFSYINNKLAGQIIILKIAQFAPINRVVTLVQLQKQIKDFNIWFVPVAVSIHKKY